MSVQVLCGVEGDESLARLVGVDDRSTKKIPRSGIEVLPFVDEDGVVSDRRSTVSTATTPCSRARWTRSWISGQRVRPSRRDDGSSCCRSPACAQTVSNQPCKVEKWMWLIRARPDLTWCRTARSWTQCQRVWLKVSTRGRLPSADSSAAASRGDEGSTRPRRPVDLPVTRWRTGSSHPKLGLGEREQLALFCVGLRFGEQTHYRLVHSVGDPYRRAVDAAEPVPTCVGSQPITPEDGMRVGALRCQRAVAATG